MYMEMVAANYIQQESRVIASGTEKQLPKQRTQIMSNDFEYPDESRVFDDDEEHEESSE
jgi:hypothetical protein